MNSTRGLRSASGGRLPAPARSGRALLFSAGLLWLAAACWLAGPARALAAEGAMPRPPELERDVQFWVRVYTQVDTNSGFLHDEHNLAVVYQTLHFDPGASPRERERLVEQAKSRYAAALRRIAAAGDGPLSDEDQKIREMWADEGTPARLRDAADEVRFQLGQSDRFRAGLVRSGAWETHIAETLANLGLPAELAVLPHVESSFNPAAYSKVGAAGLWQFMRSTGRRYMRIDSAVDDRLDPFRSTEAAAQLLAYNYRLLGTWPLALTAYNHGAEGVRRAKDTLGTDDIARIVRSYHSRTFGFASRNFYVSFLAALEIDRNPEKYFGSIERAGEAKFQEVTVPGFVNIGPLTHALKVDAQQLRALNPALLRSVWDGRRHVPKAYHLRLPLDGEKWTNDMLAQRLAPNELFAGQPEPRRYRVRSGDTLASVAALYGVSEQELAQMNRLRSSAHLRVGRSILVPEASAGTLVAAAASAPTPAANALASVSPQASGAASAPSAPAVTAQNTAVASSGDSPGVYVVQRGDALSEIARKTGLTEAQLLRLNGIRNRDFIFEGQQLIVKAPEEAPAASASATSQTSGGKPASGTVLASATPATPVTPVGSGAVPAEVAQRESAEDAAAVASVRGPAENAQPVSAAQAEALGPALGPAIESQQNADPTDYTVGKDDRIQVAAAETLGHYADWLDVTAQHLRQLNRMSYGRPVIIGHKIRLDFQKVSHEEFEQRRRDYHQMLQAEYFASHRILGTEVYIVRRGDALWTVTQRYGQLPVWLLQQYNPDLDLADLHPGTQVIMPKVEVVEAGGT
jgi:membrane-bound lytic murein transglycosylase D